MPRSLLPLQVNTFSGGLNTEASPLEQAPNTTSNEVNMELGRDGSRRKRLGFDYETDYSAVVTGVPSSREYTSKIFKWENAGGDPEKYLQVSQVGAYLYIFDPSLFNATSSGLIYEENLGGTIHTLTVDFTIIDGLLIVVTGAKPIKVYEYKDGVIYSEERSLLIRDFFGVEAVVSGETLTEKVNISSRPSSINTNHTYNLRNQTWAYPRYNGNDETLVDPITAFQTSSQNTDLLYPSNSDSVLESLYPDSSDSQDRLTERFFPDDMYVNPQGLSEAPKGFFIIDALERGTSRLEAVKKHEGKNTTLSFLVDTLPIDKTPGGATVVAQFSGRVWYSGFSGEVFEGDDKSPRMSSYVLFSSVVRDRTEVNQCYQLADPTSNEDAELVDSDGGFVRVDGAYGIKGLVALDDALFVLAENGVWRITGTEDSGFSAVSYQVRKITDKGAAGPNSFVQVENSLFYWGEDAIYYVSQNELGSWSAQDITRQKIQTFYSNIASRSKKSSYGFFDSFERKIRWVYREEDSEGVVSSKELILDIPYSAFTINEVYGVSSKSPRLVAVGETSPYSLSTVQEPVYVGVEEVTLLGEQVTTIGVRQLSITKEVIYLVVSEEGPTVTFSFGSYNSSGGYDWGNSETGVAYSAFLDTSPLTSVLMGREVFNEARFKKQAPYLNLFMKKTETGLDNNLNPLNPSSCLLSAHWNWTNNASSKKWSTPRQAYRSGRLYFPSEAPDSFDTGDTMVVTRNKIRGIGHSIAFRFEAEAGKDMHIHGWSFNLQANANE